MSQPAQSRNPWPIAIIAFFILFITGLVVFIAFATRNKMELVRPDYYEEEIRFQQQLDRLNRTRPLSAQVEITYDSRQQSVTIMLPGAHARHPTSGRVHFYRPSDASLDQDLALAINGQGVQHVDAKQLRAGLWKVRVQWTVDAQEYFFDQSLIIGSSHS